MSELPESWTHTTLGEVCSKPQYGWTSKAAKKGRIRYLRTTDISNGKIDWESVPFCASEPESIEKYEIRKDDIVVSRAGSVGVSIRIEEIPHKTVFASYLIRFNPSEASLPKYVEFFLKSHDYWRSISEYSAGIAVPNVNASKLAEIELPLAPLNEQKRIVKKLEKLLGKVEAAQERLDKIPIILKRFRQSILAAACSGKLTVDWRRENDRAEEWLSAKLEDVCENIVDCPHSTPRWSDTGELCVRTTNFKPNFLDLSIVRFVSETTYLERTQRLVPRTNDILYSREGGILGIACMVPKETRLCLGQRMMLMRTRQDYEPKLLMFWLNSPEVLETVRDLTGGSAAPHLNVGDIKNFNVPVPPVYEQKEIVRRVEGLFKFADQIEDRHKRARSYTDKLTQSILAKAFRGELVPQDAKDEPASVLLERIGEPKKDKELNSLWKSSMHPYIRSI